MKAQAHFTALKKSRLEMALSPGLLLLFSLSHDVEGEEKRGGPGVKARLERQHTWIKAIENFHHPWRPPARVACAFFCTFDM